MHSHLESVGLVDLLNSDPRPTFVVELPFPGSSQPCQIVHQNLALVSNPVLHDAIPAVAKHPDHVPFWDWVTAAPTAIVSPDPDSPVSHTIAYLGIFWTRHVVLERWAFMSGNDLPPSSEPPRQSRHESTKDGSASRQTPRDVASSEAEAEADSRNTLALVRAEQDQGLMLPDFTPDPEPFLDAIQKVDWDNHPLGPMDEWPIRLTEAFNQVIPDSRAIAIYWGPTFTAIYNEAFSKFCGDNHPNLLGNSIVDMWPHMKEPLERMGSSPNGNCPRVEDESRTFIKKSDGTLEETYLKWSLAPIFERRKCIGFQHSVLETTSMRLWERRMKFLVDLGNAVVAARDIKSYWTESLAELEQWSPSYDVPLTFVYSVGDDDVDSAKSRYDCPRICRLEGSLGVPEGHPIAPPILELRDADGGLAPMLRSALDTEYPLLLQTKDGTLPEHLLHGLQWRGFGDPIQAAIICPIRPTMEESVMGVLFLGLNPRRPYDNDYRQFISLFNQKLASSLASTVLLEEEARRGRNAAEQAAYDTALLQRKLEYQTEQTNRSIQNFQAVAEFIPVGMSFHDHNGNVTFANDSWHRITGYPKGTIAPGALLECVLEEDRENVIRAYEHIKVTDFVTYEFRVPRSINPPDGSLMTTTGTLSGLDERVGRHVLASAKAERNPDGTVVRMLTCLTDVTVQKHTAQEAVRRAQVAENLKRLAEFATVGMYDMSMDGRLLSANNLFWELSGLPKVDLSKVVILEPWHSCVVEEDIPVLEECMKKLRSRGRPETAEIRFKTPWTVDDASENKTTTPRWLLATFMPVKNASGIIESFTGCLSDVSLQKWQLEQETLRKDEAIESRRQQESFIDMTSHEMRNPLSAILHCTDAIIASLSRVQDIVDGAAPLTPMGSKTDAQEMKALVEGASDAEERKLLGDSIENAETIVTCAQHQKRIVDDILTMSKLDSKLLAVTPCTVNPVQIMHDALKMFEVEARRVDIVLTSIIEKSYKDLKHEFLDLDPSRVQQVLINLLTNALKFTKTGTTRSVTIRVKGSRHIPSRDMTVARFIPRFCALADEYEQPWLKGRNNPVYILFEVQDTGQGLTSIEMSSLFNKFVQASAKTHVKYGGSGLGLFISRRLTELQNGAIGVSSQPGVGSTFAFYIEAYVPSEKARKEAEMAAAVAKAIGGSGSREGGPGSSRRGTTSRDAHLSKQAHPWGNTRVDGILIVEDNLINQQITRRGLAERGYSVDVANHGIEALEKLQRSVGATAPPPAPDGASRTRSRSRSIHVGHQGGDGAGCGPRGSPMPQPIPINLVLMDMEMPIQDGLTCTRHIRELEQQGQVFCASGGRIPIVAVTANARPEQVMEAKEAGCDDVLVKPYRIPELMETMQLVIRRMGGLSPNSPMGG